MGLASRVAEFGGLDAEIPANRRWQGQAALLHLTRVLLAHPGLVVLDEPTSAFDVVTEQRVVPVRRGLAGRPAIVITHRAALRVLGDEI